MKPTNSKATLTFDLSHYDLELAIDQKLRERYDIPEKGIFNLTYDVTPEGDKTTIKGYYTTQENLPGELKDEKEES